MPCFSFEHLNCAAEVPSFTQVPKAKTEEEAITGALALAHDCQAAYGEAAKKAEDAELKKNLEKFAGQASSQIDQWRGEPFAVPAALVHPAGICC